MFPTKSQFQLAFAHGLTAHKSQGQTIREKFAVYCNEKMFQHGQRYVMLSRASDPALMRIDMHKWRDDFETYSRMVDF